MNFLNLRKRSWTLIAPAQALARLQDGRFNWRTLFSFRVRVACLRPNFRLLPVQHNILLETGKLTRCSYSFRLDSKRLPIR
jgi:hypothetical protein